MDEELSPDQTQLSRYRHRTLSPEELLVLSDCFVRHPEWRPTPRWPAKESSDTGVCFFPPLVYHRVGYDDLVAKLDGTTDFVRSEILDFLMANDPLSTDYLADLAVFRMEMELLSGTTHGPLTMSGD